MPVVSSKSARRLPMVLVPLLIALFQASCSSNGHLLNCITCGNCSDHEDKVAVCERGTVRALAHDLDELQEHIEKFGSIVAAHPDVWGQARLTKHREEYEKEMLAELDTFKETLQGSVSGSDQAYFADAFALSAAASASTGGGGGGGLLPKAKTNSGSSVSISTTIGEAESLTPTGASGSAMGTLSGLPIPAPAAASGGTAASSSSSALKPLALPDQSDTFAGFKSISRTPVRNGPTLQFAGAQGGITLEPTVYLDQKSRYLNHLQQLRRINEGDDTADSPGYALNLVRIPVSVLPGRCTEIGHGAEITMTLEPYLSDELLPQTFRNLILNDIVDQIGLPLTVYLNNPDNKAYFSEDSAADLDELVAFGQEHKIADIISDDGKVINQDLFSKLQSLRFTLSLQNFFARPEWLWVDKVLEASSGQNGQGIHNARMAQQSKNQSAETFATANIVAVPASKSRRARLPFPPSQMFDVYGQDFLFHIALDAYRTFGRLEVSKPCVDSCNVNIHLPDIQSYLQEELAGAYKFLADQPHCSLWQFCTPHLAAAIRTHDTVFVGDQLKLFKEQVFILTRSAEAQHPTRAKHSTFAALAWATIVESALLTEQLVQDMKESAVTKGCPCPHEGWLDYFAPNPSPEARNAFNDYVRCRWPIHVFALDPAQQQQNLADTFSSRREMQLAMSLAFVSGQISADNMMRFARRIEFDFATIDLNGTDIGFSHGSDTFGWRFYPRFQTPDIESNITVLFRDLLLGGPSKDDLLRQRRLEPGIRECYAVVIMPSFVPYCTLNVSSNWFGLANPEAKKLDSAYAMRLSQTVKAIENCGHKVMDADCYRCGDLERLLNKAKQLEARLPLQSTMVQIPYENTLGGFAMFNTGVTDLAPELSGWYGTPSINPKAPTTVFLVGNHFSVHQTRVIAGGQEVGTTELLSRQVMKAVIPANPIMLGNAEQRFVDVHLATPYGVTQHLLIPVCDPPKADGGDSKGTVWSPATFELGFTYGGLGISAVTDTSAVKYRPANLLLQPGDIDGTKYPTVDITLAFDKHFQVNSLALHGVPFDAQKKGYVVAGDKFQSALFGLFGPKFGPETTNPPCNLVVAAADLTFHSNGGKPPILRKAGNSLTIGWIKAAQGGSGKTGATTTSDKSTPTDAGTTQHSSTAAPDHAAGPEGSADQGQPATLNGVPGRMTTLPEIPPVDAPPSPLPPSEPR